ncbi:hypothetical protein M408DRAFT_104498 [Serendipita vermifera MAFF 305830]|uniref:Uncharacterized protein n=1 Tax=Serendipita vermifera MAFF 305830 TaxID=933852 RepID=A0A0C3A9S8_SERVB|nr:hypothetical protein M408DRAFT_104498 [Serendipita vermifera MAFF 305830]
MPEPTCREAASSVTGYRSALDSESGIIVTNSVVLCHVMLFCGIALRWQRSFRTRPRRPPSTKPRNLSIRSR